MAEEQIGLPRRIGGSAQLVVFNLYPIRKGNSLKYCEFYPAVGNEKSADLDTISWAQSYQVP